MTKEVSFNFDINLPKTEVICKSFEDNQSFIAVAEYNKFSLRTKHSAIKYHHLQSFLQNKIIQICYIDTREQTANIFTNTLDKSLFIYLIRKLSGW